MPLTLKVRVSTQSGLFEIGDTDEELVCTGHVSQIMANPGPLRAETAAGCGHGLNHTTYTAHSNGGPSGLKTLGKEGFYRAHTTPGIRRQDAYRNVAEATLDCKSSLFSSDRKELWHLNGI